VLLLTAYLPGSPSALIWPYEWAIILTWAGLGLVLFLSYGVKHARHVVAG
jgi:APA family basic amino acid/polyamine antiporter